MTFRTDIGSGLSKLNGFLYSINGTKAALTDRRELTRQATMSMTLYLKPMQNAAALHK